MGGSAGICGEEEAGFSGSVINASLFFFDVFFLLGVIYSSHEFTFFFLYSFDYCFLFCSIAFSRENIL